MQTRGECAIRWVQQYCVYPSGPERGQRVKLTTPQREIVHRVYDRPNGLESVPISGPLAAYLQLWHLCGPPARDREPAPRFEVDVFTLWGAAGPDLREVLKLDRGVVCCPELNTRWPAAA